MATRVLDAGASTSPETRIVQTTIRLREGLKLKAERIARAENVSLNELMINAMTQYVAVRADALADKLEAAARALRSNRMLDVDHKLAFAAIIDAEAKHADADPTQGRSVSATTAPVQSAVETILKKGRLNDTTKQAA